MSIFTLSKKAFVGLLLSLFCLVPANADMLLMGMGTGNGSGAPAYTGPGDIVSGAFAWYGLRAYSAAVAATGTQKAINVKRSSDNETCDVLIATSGNLGNTANCSGADNGISSATFCNATTCSVVTVYDQSGNGRDATQATAANRPTLIQNAIGSLPGFQHASQFWTASFSNTTPGSLTTTWVAKRTGSFTSFQTAGAVGGSNNNGQTGFNNTSNHIYGGNAEVVGSGNDSAYHTVTNVNNGASSVINIDGTETTGTESSPSTINSIGVASLGGGGAPLSAANSEEVGFWTSSFTGTQRTNMCHNQFTYWGTPTSC